MDKNTQTQQYTATNSTRIHPTAAPQSTQGGSRQSQAATTTQTPPAKSAAGAAPQPVARATLISAADITPRRVEWLWHTWLAKGKFTVLAGNAGAGKTTIALQIAATVSRGGQWPDGAGSAPIGNVVIWSGEDDISDVLVPRLLAMGADCSRIHFVTGSTDAKNRSHSFNPAKDLNLLATTLRDLGEVALLIMDPVVSAVRGDMHRANDVRGSLEPIVALAAEHGAAVIGITHFSKGNKGSNPADRVIGSQAFGALARMVLVAVRDESTNLGVVARAKTNIACGGGGISYGLEETSLPGGIQTTRVRWGETVTGTAQALLGEVEGSEAGTGEPSRVGAAVRFLQETLAHGPMATTEVLAAGQRAGFSPTAIKRARAALKVVSQRIGSGIAAEGSWLMSLPDHSSDPSANSSAEQENAPASNMNVERLRGSMSSLGGMNPLVPLTSLGEMTLLGATTDDECVEIEL